MVQVGHRHIFAILTAVCCLFGWAAAHAQNVLSVQVDAADPIEFADFDTGWAFAMTQQEATITLLADITRTQTINYRPAAADARHIFDLNNHTITDNTSDRLLVVNKADAKLTITDHSATQGGCLYKRMESDVNIYTIAVYQGELEMAGGKLYCENTIDDPDEDNWHPAVALNSTSSPDAVIRVTGGMVESVATMTAYAISSYSSLYITGGHMRATVTKYKNARALSQQRGVAYIYGGTLEAFAVGTALSSYTVAATGWIGTTEDVVYSGEVYISGGTFLAETETNNVCVVRTEADIKKFGDRIVKARGKMHISGGTFTARASDPSARQIFAAVSNGSRLFDDQTPHHLLEESLSEMTISGGTFLVDTRDDEGNYVPNESNIDLLRNWGKLDISGGTFTIYQYKGATGIGCYRNKVTVTGNPTFNIYGAYSTRGVIAGPWNHEHYCDADASKNKAEIEIFGGTFNVVSDSIDGNSIAAWANGGLSAESDNGAAGYAMQATVTIHNGQFTSIHPHENYAYIFRQDDTKTGAYGTAEAKIIVYDGKFRALTGTETENTPNGRNIISPLELAYLAGGYYVNYSQLATHANDDCCVIPLTEADPEYAEGYRYTVVPGPGVAKVTTGSTERFYSSFARAFSQAQKHPKATITLLSDIDYIGETLNYNAAPDNAVTTFDLNGHSLVVKDLTTTFCVVDKDNTTLTIKDSGTGGLFGITGSSRYGYLLVLRKGKVILESGTLFSENTSTGMYTVQVVANGTNDAVMEIKGGKIQAASASSTYAVLAKNMSDQAASLVTVSGGEVEASSTGRYAFALTAASGGKITVTGTPKISATDATYETQALRAEPGGTIDVQGGRFSAVKGQIAYRADDATIALRGGYFNELSDETFRHQIEHFCAPPYYSFPTTNAERSAYGAEYKWKVEELSEKGFRADIVDVDNTNHTLTLNVSHWDLAGWPYHINKAAYAQTARAVDQTMKIAYTGEPGDTAYILVQKYRTDGAVASHHTYVIPQEITSDTTITTDQHRPLFVKRATLTVDGNISTQKIYVAPDAKIVVNSGKRLTAEALVLRTTPERAAELENAGAVAGPVYYTRIITSKDAYFPFGLPVNCELSTVGLSNGAPINYLSGSGWVLRSYRESSRAVNGAAGYNWETLPTVGTITGGVGYEMFSGVDYYREFYFPIDLSQLTNRVTVTHSDGEPSQAGWNLLVSPFTHTYTHTPAPEGIVVAWMQPDGSFYQEMPTAIPPAKPFAYQAADNGYLSFEDQALVDQSVQWIHLDITDADGAIDQTTVYSHPTRYTQTYQTGIDVAKQSLTASRPLLYSSLAYGDMAFAGVSDVRLDQGIALTLYSPKSQSLTVSLRDNEWLDRLEEVWLIDMQTGSETDLFDSDYTFDTDEGTTRGRLFLRGRFTIPPSTLDIDPVSDASTQGKVQAQKLLVRDKLYIRTNGHLYDAMGNLIK